MCATRAPIRRETRHGFALRKFSGLAAACRHHLGNRANLAPLSNVGSNALVLLLHPSVPARNVAELMALLKRERLEYMSGTPSGIRTYAESFVGLPFDS